MTAIRETFEESGLLLASPSTSTPLSTPPGTGEQPLHPQAPVHYLPPPSSKAPAKPFTPNEPKLLRLPRQRESTGERGRVVAVHGVSDACGATEVSLGRMR